MSKEMLAIIFVVVWLAALVGVYNLAKTNENDADRNNR